MKSDDYWTTSVYDKPGGKILWAPNSRCECPCGDFFCSHLLGKMGAVSVVQTLQGIAALFPPPIKSVVRVPIPWSFAFERNKETKKRTVCYKTPKASRKKARHNCSPMIVFEFPSDSSESEYDDPEYTMGSDNCESEGSSVYSFDSKKNINGNGSDNELEEDDEEGSALSDGELENLAQDEVVAGDETTKYFVCYYARKMVVNSTEGSSSLRSGPMMDLKDTSGYKVTVDAIEKTNQELLSGKGGPNESLNTKKEQLKFHERLHRLYEKGRLPKSHYLLAQLSGCGDEPITMPPTRLRNIPLGINLLADRGFAACAPMYNHLNPQVTPFF